MRNKHRQPLWRSTDASLASVLLYQFPFEFHKTHFARKTPLFSKNIQNHPQNDCATVGFGEIASANIVGFLEKTGSQGYSLFTPTFADVGVDGVDLQNVKLVGSAGDMSDMMQTFSAEGALNPEYMYLPMDGFGYEDGWYDTDFALVEEIVAPGSAFLIWNSVGEGMKMQFPAAY